MEYPALNISVSRINLFSGWSPLELLRQDGELGVQAVGDVGSDDPVMKAGVYRVPPRQESSPGGGTHRLAVVLLQHHPLHGHHLQVGGQHLLGSDYRSHISHTLCCTVLCQGTSLNPRSSASIRMMLGGMEEEEEIGKSRERRIIGNKYISTGVIQILKAILFLSVKLSTRFVLFSLSFTILEVISMHCR